MSHKYEKASSDEDFTEAPLLNSKNFIKREIKEEPIDTKNNISNFLVVKTEKYEDYQFIQNSMENYKNFSTAPKILVCPINKRTNGGDAKQLQQQLDLIQEGKSKDYSNLVLFSQQKETPCSTKEYYISNVGVHSAAEPQNLKLNSSENGLIKPASCQPAIAPCSSSSSSSSPPLPPPSPDNSDKKCCKKGRVKLSVLDESLRYRHIRELNNLASKRLRERKKREKEDLYNQLTQLEKENFKLKKQMESLEVANKLLRTLLLNC